MTSEPMSEVYMSSKDFTNILQAAFSHYRDIRTRELYEAILKLACELYEDKIHDEIIDCPPYN